MTILLRFWRLLMVLTFPVWITCALALWIVMEVISGPLFLAMALADYIWNGDWKGAVDKHLSKI